MQNGHCTVSYAQGIASLTVGAGLSLWNPGSPLSGYFPMLCVVGWTFAHACDTARSQQICGAPRLISICAFHLAQSAGFLSVGLRLPWPLGVLCPPNTPVASASALPLGAQGQGGLS